jgi:hypothetical protein
VAQPIFCQNENVTFTGEKSGQKSGLFLHLKKLTKENKSQNWRKFAPSGHPAGYCDVARRISKYIQHRFAETARVARCFPNQNPNLGKFWSCLDWKMLIYFMTVWNILQTFGICHGPLVHFVLIWYIFSGFGIMHQ